MLYYYPEKLTITMRLLIVLVIFSISVEGFGQSEPKLLDTISGFYLTKSHKGFTGQNFETLILEEKPYIYITQVEEVSRGFSFNQIPVVNIKLNTEATEKLRMASTQFLGQPLVIVFGKKILMAPTMHSTIDNGLLEISGNLSMEETEAMTNWIKKRIEK